MNNLHHQQRALFLPSLGGNFAVEAAPVTEPGPGQVVVRIKAAALNPADWKMQKHSGYIKEFPTILGTDAAGEVVAIGEGVTKFQIGDRVLCQGRLDNAYASFQEYMLADEHHLAKVPDNLSYDQAASVPLGLATAYLAMYNAGPHGAGIASPADPSNEGLYRDEPIVVIGGATSVGQFAIQLAKLSGFSPIITTASVKHADHLKSLGTTNILDRNLSPSFLKSEVEKITSKPIKYVFDAVSLKDTQRQGDAVLASGGHLMLVMPPAIGTNDKHFTPVLAMRDLEFNVKPLSTLYGILTSWLESGAIKPNRVELLPDGLNGIVKGLGRLENNEVSGAKLVIRPEETN